MTLNVFLDGLMTSVFSSLEIQIGIFILISVIITFLLRKKKNVQSYGRVLNIVRLSRFTGFIKSLARFGKLTRIISEIGLILGFGVFASDFMYGRHRSLPERLAIFIATLAGLYLFYTYSVLNAIGIAPVMKPYAGILAIVFSVFGFSGLVLGMLFAGGLNILLKTWAGETSCPNVGPLIPGVQVPQMPIFIPLHGWIGLFLAIIIHESSHGIQAISEKIKLKSSGFLLAGFIPIGAFVEPDEEQLKKSKDMTKLRIYSAGPASNLISIIPMFIFAGLLVSIITPYSVEYNKSYLELVDFVQIASVSEKLEYCGNPPAPAFGKLEPGMVLLKINDLNVSTRFDVLSIINKDRFDGAEFTVEKDNVIQTISIVPFQETGTFGFEAQDVLFEGSELPEVKLEYVILSNLYVTVTWAFLIAFLLALTNFLPVAVLDGGQIGAIIFPYYLKPFVKDKKMRRDIVQNFFIGLVLLLVIINALPFFL